jgi:ribosomal protein L37AE/L43A
MNNNSNFNVAQRAYDNQMPEDNEELEEECPKCTNQNMDLEDDTWVCHKCGCQFEYSEPEPDFDEDDLEDNWRN